MKAIGQSYRLVNDQNQLKNIETIARLCYKSEAKIDEGSYIPLIKNLIKSNHMAMLEHSNYIFEVDRDQYLDMKQLLTILQDVYTGQNNEYPYKCYLRFSQMYITKDKITTFNSYGFDDKIRYLISGSLRAWLEFLMCARNYLTSPKQVENIPVLKDVYGTLYKYALKELDLVWFDMFQAKDYREFEPFDVMADGTIQEMLIHQTFSVIFTTNRAIANELVRHRPASFGQESTRYVNYAKADEIEFIKPYFIKETLNSIWEESMTRAELAYFSMIEAGAKPEEARGVLPLDTKTEIGMTATLSEWNHIFNLRWRGTTGKPHPQMFELMDYLISGEEIDDYLSVMELS